MNEAAPTILITGASGFLGGTISNYYKNAVVSRVLTLGRRSDNNLIVDLN